MWQSLPCKWNRLATGLSCLHDLQRCLYFPMREIWRHPNFLANSIELTTSGCVIMTTSWLHALLEIIHNVKHHTKVRENKETDSPSGIYRMKLLGTSSLSKESHEKKKKKMGLLFWGSGTPTFWLGLLLFTKRGSRTPTFKILVKTLGYMPLKHLSLDWYGQNWKLFDMLNPLGWYGWTMKAKSYILQQSCTLFKT